VEMIVIGIVGGIASGKSLVSRRLSELGAEVLDADRIGHQVLRDPEVQRAIRDRWGERVFDADGQVDRGRLATIVFGDPPGNREELDYLEQLTHPRIRQCLCETMERMARADAGAVLVLDAALLLEAGWDRFCDKILFVEAPRSVRLDRAKQRGWTEAGFAAREAAQASVEKKRERADIVIDNSSTPEHTYNQLETMWRALASG
jgi:dephospho-CoA kinase